MVIVSIIIYYEYCVLRIEIVKRNGYVEHIRLFAHSITAFHSYLKKTFIV